MILNQEDAQYTNTNHNAADDQKNGGPVRCVRRIHAHKTTENYQNRYQRHHRIDALSSAAIGVIGGIRQPRIKCGIVSGRSKESHNTIQHNGECHTQRSRRYRREQRTEIIDPQ